MGKHVQINYSRITPQIYLGTNACCIRHFDLKLLQKGIRADVSLQKERVDSPQGVRYFLWLPTKDLQAPSIDALTVGTEFMNTVIVKKQKVYVHCLNGHGRSPALVAAYFIRFQHMSVDEAIKRIKNKRPEIHIEVIQHKALQRFYKKYGGAK